MAAAQPLTGSLPFKPFTVQSRTPPPSALSLGSLDSKLFGLRVARPDPGRVTLYLSPPQSSVVVARYGGGPRSSGDARSKQSEDEKALDLSTLSSATVRLIDEQQNMVGVMPKLQAIQLAEDADLDLVILSPDADPPVVRIMDYNKYRYEQNKKKKEQQKRSAASRMDLKELRMSYNIDQHDYTVRLKSTQKFLKEGDKVKVTVTFGQKKKKEKYNLRRLEAEFRSKAIELIRRLQNDVGELAMEESKKFSDTTIFIVLAPNKTVLQKAPQDPQKKKEEQSASEDEPSVNEVPASI